MLDSTLGIGIHSRGGWSLQGQKFNGRNSGWSLRFT
jgi:hypothetical protein